MNNILVTGGSGFIGSHTCLVLLENNFKVIVIDSFENSSLIALEKVKLLLKNKNPKIIGNLKVLKGDLTNFNSIYKIIKNIYSQEKIDAVIHFAGLKSVSESINQPLKYWDSNITGSINLFKIMDFFNIHNLIFSSSATIYSSKNELPLKEDSLLEPINPYGNTKFTIEKILEDIFYSAPNKWRICNLRYFNPIGAHPSGLIGENPKVKPNNIFPIILNAAFSPTKKLEIFGNDWKTHDGTCIRDYIHIMDLADGHMISLKYLLNNSPDLININLGTGKGTSVLELIKVFEFINNIKINYVFSKRREGDLPRVVADNRKAFEILKWLPKRNLNDMCRDGWKWKCLNPKGYNDIT